MKVVFLDVDGVLNNHYSMCQYQGRLWPPLVHKLNGLCHEDVSFVLSSAWRILYDIETMKTLLHNSGWLYSHKLIDRTRSGDGIRGEQIKNWLDEHPEVTHYAILDDDSDMLDEQQNNFVHVERAIGLMDQDIHNVKEILEIE